MRVHNWSWILIALGLFIARPGQAMEQRLPQTTAVKSMHVPTQKFNWLTQKVRSLFVGVRLDINININQRKTDNTGVDKLPGSGFKHDFTRIPVHTKAPKEATEAILIKSSTPTQLGYNTRPIQPLLVAPSSTAVMVR